MENDLRDVRESKGFTIRQVEAGTGINRGDLSKIEKQGLKPTVDQRRKLEDFLDSNIKFWHKIKADPDF